MTGGAGEEGAKEEEEGVRIINRKVVAEFWGPGGIDTPYFLLGGGGTGRASSHEPQGHLSSENHNSWCRVMMFDVVQSHA